MTNLVFGTSSRAASPSAPVSALRVQTSILGKPIPIGWGAARISGNLIGYWDFTAIAVQSSTSGGGGKGGIGGGGGGGKSGSGAGAAQYLYTTAVAIGLCEGPITQCDIVWWNKSEATPGFLNFANFSGDYSQTAWGYLQTLHPGDAYNYRGLSYEVAAPFELGNSSSLPNFTFRVLFGICSLNSPAIGLDVTPDLCAVDALTNAHYGVGFPSSFLGDVNGPYALYTWQQYCLAAGLVVSPVLDTQAAISKFLDDLVKATNSEWVWSQGKLRVVPRGDSNISGNGGTYTAPSQPIYSLGDDDFKQPSNNKYTAPIIISIKRIADQMNSVSVEYLDSSNNYNTAIVEVRDDAAIQQWGLRKADPKSVHHFKSVSAASMSAYLLLGLEKVVRTFQFTVGPEYIALDPMDIIAISEVATGLVDQWVRITEITENSDYSLTITADEYLAGTATSPLYGQNPNNGAIPNYYADPGGVNQPFIFEPPDTLGGGLEIWIGISPQNPALWGGCDVYASYDGITYRQIGRQMGPSRMGVLSSGLASIAASTVPPTIDNSNTLAVDLTQSQAALTSGSFSDLLAGNTACWLGSTEIVAFETATLTATYKYNLTTLNRGLYGTTIAAASNGATFVRLDDGVFAIPYTQDRIGAVVYFKFVSFNHFLSGPQSLASSAAFTYTIQGSALSSPLPSVVNFFSVYTANVTNLSWTEIQDFRPVQYELRKGTTWAGGSFIGRFAHPPVPTLGDGQYWLNSYSQPVPGLQVYGSTPIGLSISGSVLPLNVKASFDEIATGATGTLTGLIFDGTFIRTFGSSDILAVSDVFAIQTIGQATVTVSIASPAVVTWTAHNLVAGQPVFIGTTGALPTGLVALQTYYVLNPTTNTFQLSTTPLGAAINTTGSQSGTHTAYAGGDIFAFGTQSSGNYEVPINHEVDVGYVAPCLIAITFSSSGVPANNNFFAYLDLFSVMDFFGAAANAFIGVVPQIALSQDGVTWGAWQNYAAGVQNARKFKARWLVNSLNAGTIAFLTQAIFTVYVPTRVDNWAIITGTRTSLNLLTVPISGLTLTFLPDSQATAAPFNAGVSNPGQPLVRISILGWQTGDIPVYTNLTLSGMTLQILNAGTPVQRQINLEIVGF